jgi:hypothetical protein
MGLYNQRITSFVGLDYLRKELDVKIGKMYLAIRQELNYKTNR